MQSLNGNEAEHEWKQTIRNLKVPKWCCNIHELLIECTKRCIDVGLEKREKSAARAIAVELVGTIGAPMYYYHNGNVGIRS